MAAQTGRTSLTYDEFQRRFGQRLRGMAASHDLLVNQNWQGVDIATLVRAQLLPFAEDTGGRLKISGPAVLLTPAAAQAIGLALHELATNATKYGALSSHSGQVHITWATVAGPPQPRFTMSWAESGGPPVSAPQRRGFGHTVFDRMIRQSLNATITLDYDAGGVRWFLESNLASVTQDERSVLPEPPHAVADRRATS